MTYRLKQVPGPLQSAMSAAPWAQVFAPVIGGYMAFRTQDDFEAWDAGQMKAGFDDALEITRSIVSTEEES